MRMARVLESRWLGWVLVAVAVAVVVAMSYLLRNSFYGDPSIYLPYARNAADGEFPAFNPGEYSSGCTSPIWPLLMAPAYLFGLDEDGAKIVGLGATAVAVVLVAWSAMRSGAPAVAAGVGTFAVVALVGLYGALLYETPLAVALVALSIVAGERLVRAAKGGERLGPSRLVPLVAIWALMPLARPELAALVVLQALVLWLATDARRAIPARALAGALTVAAVPAVVWFGASLVELGTYSTSAQGRSFAQQEAAERLGPLYWGPEAPRYVLDAPVVFAFLAGIAGLALLVRRAETRWLGLYGLGGIGIYLVLLTFISPAAYDVERYLVPAFALVAVGVGHLIGAVRERRLYVPALAAAAGLVALPAIHDAQSEARTIRDREYTVDRIMEGEAARHVNRLARPGETVLAYEVQVRYLIRDDVDVLALDGVTDGKVHPYQQSGDLTAFLRRYKPRFWISRAETGAQSRKFIRGSILSTVYHRFAADASLTELRIEGIGFRRLAGRTAPMPDIFGGWKYLFELDYGEA